MCFICLEKCWLKSWYREFHLHFSMHGNGILRRLWRCREKKLYSLVLAELLQCSYHYHGCRLIPGTVHHNLIMELTCKLKKGNSDAYSSSAAEYLTTETFVTFWARNIFHFMWFQIKWNRFSAVVVGSFRCACLDTALSLSLTKTLFFPSVPSVCLCFSAAAAVGHACKWARGDRAIIQHGASPAPPFIRTLMLLWLSCLRVPCIHNVSFTDVINAQRNAKCASWNPWDRDSSFISELSSPRDFVSLSNMN